MQNKGAIKFLAIVLAIACAYQLSFTFVTKNVERKAQIYAGGDPVKEQNYLDSMKNQTVYNLGFVKFDYKYCKDWEINLGLDLRGGMNVMLEISVEDVLKALSNNSKDPIFTQALADARTAQRNSTKDFITLFRESFERQNPGTQLAHIFNTPELRDKIMPTSSNQEVIDVLRKQSDDAITNSYNVLRNRIDRFGVTQPNIQRLENSGRILVELPGVKEPERVRKLLQGTASLEFWSTYNYKEIAPLLGQINTAVANYYANGAPEVSPVVDTLAEAQTPENAPVDSTVTEQKDSSSLLAKLAAKGESDSTISKENLFFSKLTPMQAEGPVVGLSTAYDTMSVNAMLSLPQVRAVLPRDLRFMWGVKPNDNYQGKDGKKLELFELYAIKANTRDGNAPLDGSVVMSAEREYSQQSRGNADVSMSMSAEGARKWARLTADNVGNYIAIVLDGFVYSAPRVSGEITGGRSSITGNFTDNEARDLANVLRSGKLPAPAHIIQDTVVGPSLGQESINSGMTSFILAFILVLLYMWLYYNRAGFIANIALLANLFFLFGVLVSMKAVLTLPGIAGIVLTMGMAVDANVIIYERIKEELRSGKGLSQSIYEGFKNALSAIIDGNATTLITGIVLFLFGKGPVQGFATTLIIGIITSLFCAIFIPRLIFASRVAKGKLISFSNRHTENFLINARIDFIRIRKIAYIISGVMLLATFVSMATRGMNYGVDFSGGRAFVVRFDKAVTANEVRDVVNAAFKNAGADEATSSIEVKQYGNDNQMRILTQYKFDETGDNVTAEIEGLLYNALLPLYSQPLTLDQFTTTAESPLGIISSEKVGPSVAHDIKINSIIAVLFSLLAIGIYIILRFGSWQWAMGGVISLLHDALITIGIFSLLHGFVPFSMEVDQSFIAAILTIIGYSINDTVINFDRIREYRKLYPKRSLKENINKGINSTMARTINTSGTTLIVLLSIFLFGGEVIRGFVFALMFGILIGTYSSVFVATPIAYDFMGRSEKKTLKEEEAK